MFLTKSKKSPYYQLTYEVNGKRTTISTRAKTKKEAEIFLQQFVFGNVEAEEIIAPISLKKFKDEYVEYVKLSKSKHYIRSITLSFDHLVEFVGDVDLSRIDSRILDKFISVTFARAEYAAALYFRTLKAAFSKAVTWNYINSNPFKKIKAPKTSKSYPTFINENEFQQIIDHTKEKFLKDLFKVGFYTGMRLGEIVNMKWSWINTAEKIITIKCTSEFITKAKRERVIPVSSKLDGILLAPTQSDGYIFTRINNIRLNEDYVSKKFKKAVKFAELSSNIHFHTLRHSFASNLVQKGASLYVVKELMGHQNLTTTQIYSHLDTQNLLDAVYLL